MKPFPAAFRMHKRSLILHQSHRHEAEARERWSLAFLGYFPGLECRVLEMVTGVEKGEGAILFFDQPQRRADFSEPEPFFLSQFEVRWIRPMDAIT